MIALELINQDNYVELMLAMHRLFEASPYRGGASGSSDVAARVGRFGRVGGGEFVGVLRELDVSPERNCPSISAVNRIEPEKFSWLERGLAAGAI
jgi:hypothetical protein